MVKFKCILSGNIIQFEHEVAGRHAPSLQGWRDVEPKSGEVHAASRRLLLAEKMWPELREA